MSNLKDLLQTEYERMQRIRGETETRVSQNSDVEGRLRISAQENKVSYYHRMPEGKANGEYLSKNEMNLIQKLAQKTYDERILKLVTKRERQLAAILRDFRDDEIENVYLEEHPLCQALITPVEPTWQQIVDQWMDKPYPYKKKGFTEQEPIIYTNRKERVRSKTERMIADYLNRRNIRYKYECPILLPTFGYVYPDFTLLSKKTGKEVYWEHDGMMDNPDYARSAVKKIEAYQKAGILVGDRLILTFETSSCILNEDMIRMLVEQYL